MQINSFALAVLGVTGGLIPLWPPFLSGLGQSRLASGQFGGGELLGDTLGHAAKGLGEFVFHIPSWSLRLLNAPAMAVAGVT